MRRLGVIVCALGTTSAMGQPIPTDNLGPAWKNDDPNIALRVCNGACPSTLQGSWGESITFTRASVWTCVDDSGAVRDLATGIPCLVQGAGGTPYGARLRPQLVNVVQNSRAFATAPWSTAGSSATVTVTNNSTDVTDPKGGNTASRIVIADTTGLTTAQAAINYQQQTLTASNWIQSVYLRTLSGTATVQVGLQNGSTFFCNTATVTSTWSRPATNGTATAATWSFEVGVDRRCAGNPAGQPAQTIYAWEDLGENTPGSVPSDPCTTGAASATCGPETAQMAASTPALAVSFCASADASGVWGNINGPFGTGTVTSANSWHFYQQSGSWFFDLYDTTPALKEWSFVQALTPGSQHHIRLCYDGAGDTPLLWVDSAPKVFGAPTGAGTGVLANASAALLVGSAFSNQGQLGGTIQNYCVGNCSPGPAGIAACGVCP